MILGFLILSFSFCGQLLGISGQYFNLMMMMMAAVMLISENILLDHGKGLAVGFLESVILAEMSEVGFF